MKKKFHQQNCVFNESEKISMSEVLECKRLMKGDKTVYN